MKLRHRVPIIKAVGDNCNLRCTYCFYNGKDQKTEAIMSDDLLESFLSQYFSLFSGELRFVWHGGEPLLAGINFYERALAFQRKFAKRGDVVENMIQTNATLITGDWAKFFKRNDFRVGISIDGAKKRRDGQRLNVGGRGSFDQVLAGLASLRKHGITPGVIQTVLRSGVDTLSEDFRFFSKELKINSWALNLFMDGSSDSRELVSEGLRDEDVDRVYTTLIDEWLKASDSRLCVREIENVVAGSLRRRATNCSFNGTCANYFCLDSRGRVWPCDRFSSDEKFMLGDINKTSLLNVLEGELSARHALRACELADDCTDCRWQKACNNGCTAMRSETDNKYVYCAARQKAFRAVEALLSVENPDGYAPD